MARRPKRKARSAEEDAAYQEFREAARKQRVCAVTKKGGPFDPHHVVYEQHLVDRGHPRYHPANALRLSPTAHQAHHYARSRQVRTRELRDENLAYAFGVLGPYAVDYLRRYYDDTTDPDPRLRLFEEELLGQQFEEGVR